MLQELSTGPIGWAALLGSIALLVSALARGVPRVLTAVESAVKGWRERVKSESTSAETVRQIASAMIAKLEFRIVVLEKADATCRDELRRISEENVALTTRVKTLEDELSLATTALADEQRRVAVIRAEYERLLTDLESGGGSADRALPQVGRLDSVDVVDLRGKRRV